MKHPLFSNSNQIKSATDNNGMFSPENPDIQEMRTADGREVLGYAHNGRIYLDFKKLTKQHRATPAKTFLPTPTSLTFSPTSPPFLVHF